MRTRLRLFAFASAAILTSLAGALALLFAADLYAHHRVERTAGYNWRGYRGPTVGSKQPGELRVAMLGGSTVFGYGVAWDETIPAALEHLLRERSPGRPVTVVNLGIIGEGAYSFLPNMLDFADLQFDVVCFYEGYNDLLGDPEPNTAVVRRSSIVYQLTGYFPVLPMVLKEKVAALRYGGAESAYETDNVEGKPVFRPNLLNRTSASALEATQKLSEALGRQLDRLSREKPTLGPAGKAGCQFPWAQYCDSILAATEYATSHGMGVVVAAQPALTTWSGADRHALQEKALGEMAARVLSNNPLVRFADVSKTVNLSDPALAFDGMHLTPPGNRIIAQALLDPIEAVAAARQKP